MNKGMNALYMKGESAKKMRIGIVVIGYKNDNSIRRLLNQLNKAEYLDKKCALVISIDKADNDRVKKVADDFKWEHGTKTVFVQEKRLGLRRHVLKCGDYLEVFDWDAEIVFEDDTFPSLDFFQYSLQIAEKYGQDNRIAGAGLYKFADNRSAKYPKQFLPVEKGADIFFLKFACSWGQIWFRNSWKMFREWYDTFDVDIDNSNVLPKAIIEWDDQSWLKYHIMYCVLNNKYFVYPYLARSTCFSEAGEHTTVTSNILQIPTSGILEKELLLPDFEDDNAVHYDGYFEYEDFGKIYGIDSNEIEIDVFGTKRYTEKKYLISTKHLDYTVIHSWSKQLLPPEMNIISDLVGDDIFLYDLGEGNGVLLPEEKRGIEKFNDYFDILDIWMDLQRRGVNVSTYFENIGVKTISIYGMGKLAKHLIEELRNTSIRIVYGIESNRCDEKNGVKVVGLNDNLDAVDMIVVTPTYDFEKIKRQLSTKGVYSIKSLRDIIMELWKRENR